MPHLLISQVAERAGLAAPTIRYYESIGLLRPPSRSLSGYRRYSDETVDELRFIKKAQALGFSLEEIGEILNLTRSGNIPCDHVLAMARRHLAAVEERIRDLQRFRDQLSDELAKWETTTTPSCRGLCQIIASSDVDAASRDRLDGRNRKPPR